MSPFWSGFFDQLKSCGRNGGIFIAALGGVFATVVVTVIVERSGVSFNPMIIAAAVLPALLIWITFFVRRLRMARTRLRFPRLSDDELRVARERLKNGGRRV
ncbi:MAG TPA: hypothetical protein VK327_13415 [Candidatus Paceibacterota bacterium]|nr:hypothetical protein [Candidatus Paceibacterota bacterium]